MTSVSAQCEADLVIRMLLSRLAAALSDFSEHLCCRFLKEYNVNGGSTVDYNAFLKNLSISNDFKYPASSAGKDFPDMPLRILKFLLFPKEMHPSMGKIHQLQRCP